MRKSNHRGVFLGGTAVLAASSFFTASASGADYSEYRHPALNYTLPSADVSRLLQGVASSSRESKEIAEFAGILAERLLPAVVPVGFLHQCRCIKDDIMLGRLESSSYPELLRIRNEEGDAGLEKLISNFITEVSPRVCPRDYSRILINELAA